MEYSDKYDQIRQQYLEKSKELLPFSIVCDDCLGDISEALGYERFYYQILFPAGFTDFVKFYEEQLSLSMQQKLALIAKPDRVRDKIALGLKTRIIKDEFSQVYVMKIMEFYARPQNLILAQKLHWNAVSEIWYYAGDEATDFNYYSKRGLLYAVYKASLMFYISDDSINLQDSSKFIDESIDKVLKYGMKFSKLKRSVRNKEFFGRKVIDKIPFLRMI